MISLKEIEQLEQGMQRDREALKRGCSVEPRSIGEETHLIKPRVPKPTFEKDGAILTIIPEELTYLDDLDAYARKLRVEKATAVGVQARTISCENPMRIILTGIVLPSDKKNGKGGYCSAKKAEMLDPWILISGSLADRKFLKKLGMK